MKILTGYISNISFAKLFFALCMYVFVVSDVAAQQYIQIGEGTSVTGSTTASPINIYYRSLHGQVVYTKEELNAAGFFGGVITELGFYIEGVPSHDLPNYTIGLKTTMQGDTNVYDAGAFTTVYNVASYTPVAGDFDMLTLDEPFYWTGSENLLIDICFEQVPNYTSTGTVRYYPAEYGFRYTRSDGSNQCGIPTNSNTGQKPQLKLAVSGQASNDVGVTDLTAPVDFCAGNEDIIVEVRNFGINVIDSVRVNWSFDGLAQPTVLVTNPLDTLGGIGTQSAMVTLGNKTFVNGNAYDLEVWTSFPNGMQDTLNLNDTLRTILQASLNGTYTIGGSTPDYTTISDAVADLNNYGVCGPVTFNIRNGFYDEQFSINEFSGGACDVPVIFQSETGDSTGVVINDVVENSANNYIVELNGADGVTFSGINFIGTGTYARIVYMRDGADCNTFESCVFDGSAVASTGSSYHLVASENNSNNDKNTFTQNTFKKGSYAIYLLGSSDGGIGPPEESFGFAAKSAVNSDSASLEISDNIFEEQYGGSVFLQYYNGARVVDNTLTSNSTYSSWTSIRIEGLNGGIEGLNDIVESSNGGVEISGNTISALRGTGIQLSNSNGLFIIERNLIANNFITMSGDNTTTRGIYVYYTTNTDIYHNNVNITTTNTTESVGLDMFSFNDANIMNNCIVNSGNGYAVRYDSPTNSVSDYNNFYHAGNYVGYYNNTAIADLTAWQNANGFDANSIAVNPLYTSDTDLHVNTIDLNAAGTPLTDVPNDIDGDTRDAATPDIGADEFTPPPNDAGVLDIALPDIPFPAGIYPVYGILKNYGTDDLLNANLYWEINDVIQPVINWSGTLISGDTLSVLLGDVDITVDQAYTLQAWSDLPNGAADMFPANDTTDIVNIFAGLGGEYTLGGTDPDFADFATAEDALNRGGVYAPVTINIRDGVYNEQIHLTEIIGADSTNTVTFQSESGDSTAVVIEFTGTSAENYLWYLDGADYITLKGLTFKPLNASYDVAIRIENQANFNIIENNYFDGNGIYGEMIYSGSTIDEDNIIRNNYFEDGQIAISLYGSSIRENGNMVIGNILKDQDRQAIILDDQSNVIVQNNEIENFANNSTYAGLYLYDCDEATQITGNRIVSCCRNYGIQIEYCNSISGNEGLIANNFIALLRTTSSAYGIYDRYNSYQKYYHNTINILTNDISNGRTFYAVSSSNLDVRNNIFSNEGTGYAIYTADGTIAVSDNNNLYTEGENIAYLGGNIATLTDWQGTTGLDAASVSVDPFFESDSTYVTTQVSLNGKGQPLAEVTTDIEGNPRDASTPDIGAYEFVPLAVDAGVIAIGLPEVPFAVGDHLVQAVLKNFGTDTLTSVTLDWEVNGIAQTPINWSGMLTSDDTLEVGLDFVTFELAQPYTFKIWSSQPNAQNDLVAINDTTTINDVYAGLGGSYTLGGMTPDFDNFTEAATVLNLGGVYAPVDIQIRDGSYNEQIELFEIPGADSTNQVILESENDDPTLVTLSHFSNSSNNYVLRLTDTDWLTVKGITLEATNISYSRVIWIEDNATNNVFSDNIILNPLTTSTSSNRIVIYVSNTGVNEYNGFVNNTISNGSYGIYMSGNYNNALYNDGNYIIGNTFENQYYMGVRVSDYQKNMVISDNIVNSNSAYSGYYGMYLYNLNNGISVLRNKVNTTRYGIFISSVEGSVDNPINIVNNFVQASGTTTGYGINSSYGNYHNIYHNTVSVSNTNAEFKALETLAGSNKYIKNNIFANTGGGYAYYSGTTYGITESDYNNLYATGANVAYWNGNQATLADWQTTTSFDANSVAIDPIFVSPTDLHITNVLLDKKGTPLPSVIDDIDGDTRDPILPDIGADEFSTAENDASLFSIDSPNIPFPADNQPVYVTLLNNGLDTLLTADLDWEINDQSQAPFSWTGMLLPGEQADSVLLGNFTFERDTMYSITAWSSNPNGVTDTETYNDTIQLNDLYAALSGIYTIGGVSPDYQDFTEAATALDRGGVVGEVFFDVRSETFNEQITINEIIGASADNTITFRSEAGDSTQAVLTYNAPTSADNYVIRLDGANWLRFEQMTLQSAGNTSYERVIELLNGADNNVFSNNQMIGRNTSSSSTNYAIIYSSGVTPNNNNSFLHNYIQQGNYGLYLQSGDNNNPQTGTVISGNNFEHQYYNAIYQRYVSGSEITYNQITTNKTNSSYEGIWLYNGLGGNTITHNIITEVPRGDGIYITSMNATASEPNLVANNFIQVGTGSYNLNGIWNESSYYTNIYHNNINITSTNASAKAVYIASGSNTNIQNNVLTNTGGGYAIYSNTSNNITSSDYNDLYVTGTNIGAWNNSAVTDLAAWRATSGQDANSVSSDPLFISATDLHVQEIDLNDSGTPLASVTTDIDGEPRSTTAPDIGADEFSPATNNDASVEEIISPSKDIPFPAQDQDVYVALKNNGIDIISNVSIWWSVNEVDQNTLAWTGELMPGERDTVLLGDYNFLPGIAHEIEAYTSVPNGLPDAIPANDTVVVSELYAGLSGTYSLGGIAADFENFAQAADALSKGGVLDPVEFLVNDGTYNEQINISEINGVDASNTVTFRPAANASVIIRYGYPHLLKLNGADYVTFENLTFEYTYSYTYDVVILENGADNNQFLNNIFTTTGNTSATYIYSNSSSVNNNTLIEGNTFTGAGSGVRIHGTGSSNLESGTVIKDNIFTNQNNEGINVYYNDAPEITGNLITAEAGSASYRGIYARDTDNGLRIENNRIYTHSGTGIYLYRCDGAPADHARVVNNFVRVAGTATSYGIYTYYGDYTDIYHNNIALTNTAAASRVMYSYYGSNKNIINNVLANLGGGYAIYSTGSGYVALDYNDLYTTGTILGNWSGTDATTLPNWRQLTGRDIHSVSVDPLFISDTDLHITQTDLDATAIFLPQVTLDIDGETRNVNTPDIGADEISTLPNDIGVFAIINPVTDCGLPQNDSLVIQIRNYGTQAQSGFDIAFQLDTNTPIVETVNETIGVGNTLDYTFTAPVNLPADNVYQFTIYTSLAGDGQLQNDTLTQEVIGYPEQAPMAVTPNQTICEGSGLYLEAGGEGTFQWSTGSTNTRIYVYPSVTNTYTVTNTNENGCTQTSSIIVEVLPRPDAPVVTASGSTNICAGDTIQLTSSISDNIVWSTGDTTQTITVSSQGSYYVDNYDGITNCYRRSNYTYVNVYQEPYLAVNGFTSICEGDATTLTVYNGNSYQWSTGAVTQSITVSPTEATTYFVTSTNNGGCTSVDSIMINIVPDNVPPGVVSNMLPVDGTTDITVPLTLSWLPATGASDYDIYIWQTGNPRPLNPVENNYSGINLEVSNLDYGVMYNWQIVSKTSCFESDGPIQTFSMRELSDLIVQDVQVPTTAFSGQTISIDWQIENIGNGGTGMNNWYDGVYLSPDNTFDINVDQYLGGAGNFSALQPGEAYAQTASFTLPNGIFGNYYIFIIANRNNSLDEADVTNNQSDVTSPVLVTLTPPSDLQVTSIIAPDNTFSSEFIDVEWTVTNEGEGITPESQWQDKVYISASPQFNEPDAELLATRYNNSFLDASESYNRSVSVKIPQGYQGTYYIHVWTDYKDDVYEFPYEENNVSANEINVFLELYADLVISSVNAPDEAYNNESVIIRWTATNEASAAYGKWQDRVFISESPDFDFNTAIDLGYAPYFDIEVAAGSSDGGGGAIFYVPLLLGAGESIIKQKSIIIPKDINGDYYLFIIADYGDIIFEYTQEGNNISAAIPISINSPDLEVTNITAPASAQSGDDINIDFTVQNSGAGALYNRGRTDKVYLSPTPDLSGSEILIGTKTSGGSIYTNESKTVSDTYTIPNGTNGDYYVIVWTDANESIYEAGSETNNINASTQTINISAAPAPDLTLTAVTAPDTTKAGLPVNINFEVLNQGNADALGTAWKDKLYVAATPVWTGAQDAIFLEELLRQQLLTVNGDYQINLDVVIPMLPGGVNTNICYLYVITDSEDDLFESNENNNVIRSNPIFVEATQPDLDVFCFMPPDTMTAGSTVDIRWTTRNLADSAALQYYWFWYDGVYISEDTLYDDTDEFITDYVIYTTDFEGDLYRKISQPLPVPNGIFGDYYLFMVADHTNINYDKDDTNNASLRTLVDGQILRDANGNPIPVHFRLPPVSEQSDLVIDEFNVPANGTAGQPITISWTVRNEGLGTTVIDSWDDVFYLSTDFDIGQNDDQLGSQSHIGTLAPGDTYSDTIQVTLPIDASGNYIVLLKTDDNDVLYEHQGEDDNIDIQSITIISQFPSDLIVDDITIQPDTIFNSDTAQIVWNIRNIGNNVAIGQMENAIYLSEDEVLDIGDRLVTTITETINIPPLEEHTDTIYTEINGIPIGDYYTIIAADIQNNILEVNEQNNSSSSFDLVNIGVQELPLSTLTPDSLDNDELIFYRIEIPAELEGETMLVRVNGTPGTAFNKLYLRYGNIPSETLFDEAYDNAFAATQEITIPEVTEGTYYLLTSGTALTDDKQGITLWAEIIDFSILAINTDKGSNTGTVTSLMQGAKFEENMDVKLENGISTIYAQNVQLINSTSAYVTFDLTDEETGIYDVTIENTAQETATLTDAYEVIQGILGAGGTISDDEGIGACSPLVQNEDPLQINILHPANTRLNRVVPITIQYSNNGTVDLPAPSRILISKEGAPLGITADELPEMKTELFLDFTEPGGPPGILRPGSFNSITIYTKASHPLRFLLVK